jgi:hypothetical protein
VVKRSRAMRCLRPFIVIVFPLPVWLYARMHTMPLESTSEKRSFARTVRTYTSLFPTSGPNARSACAWGSAHFMPGTCAMNTPGSALATEWGIGVEGKRWREESEVVEAAVHKHQALLLSFLRAYWTVITLFIRNCP